MRIIFLSLLIYISNCCFAQDDLYPDYRSKKDMFTRVTEKDIRSDVASFSLGGIEESVGKLPLKTIPVTDYGKNFISFTSGNTQITITTAPFNALKHKLGYYDPEHKYLIKIDNKPYFGDYGKMPKTIIENVTAIVDRDTVAIPGAAYVDLYNPILSFSDHGVQKSSNKVYVSADGHKIYIYMLKQEPGGSYEVTWVIQDKKYVRRVVDFGLLK